MPEAIHRKPIMTGGCQCGKVRYALYAKPAGMSVCHCRMCQKAVGGPFAALVPNLPGDFAWTRGEPGTFASSNIASRDFCRDCGTPLTYRGPSGRVNVSQGSLDQPQLVTPTKQYGLEGRQGWVDLLATLPGERTDQSMSPTQLQEVVNHQHPDRETGADWKV
jgi:hypothetical protein